MAADATFNEHASTVRRRLSAQLLSGPPATSVEQVANRLLAIQAQDLRGARLAIRARTVGLSVGHVDRALTADRTVVVGWLNRGTLHLVAREDYWWLHSLTTPPLYAGTRRHLRQEGVIDADRGVAVIERALGDGPLTRAQLRNRLSAANLPVAGQALVHQLYLASLRGLVMRGPLAGREQAYVLARDWLPRPARQPDRDALLGRLARRYLVGHGPATDRDLARWSGLPLREARRGLSALGSAVIVRPNGLLDVADRPSNDEPVPGPRLLGAFEPLLLGWASREPIVGAHADLVTRGGIFSPFALVAGRAAATWRLVGHRVVVAPFAALTQDVHDALAADARDVARFLWNEQP